VEAGVDTGWIVYQGKVDYRPEERYETVVRRVVKESMTRLGEVYRCLTEGRQVRLPGEHEESWYRARDYLELITAERLRRVAEIQEVYERTGWFRLRNGLVISRVLDWRLPQAQDYEVDREGIIIPLADGCIKGTVGGAAPFWLFQLLVGKKRLLAGLQKSEHEILSG
jgi:hypothetical protein